MLRNFIYLNEQQLDQYVSQVEDGLRSSLSREEEKGHNLTGTVGVKGLGGSGGKSAEQTVTQQVSDTGPARFERLLQLIKGNEEQFGWIEVIQQADVEAARVGSIIDATCELYESDATKVAGPDGILSMLPLMKMISDLSSSTGNPLAGLPSAADLDAMAAFGAAMPSVILLGDIVETDWRIVASVDGLAPGADLEGEARVVGKVSRKWEAGSWKPLPGLPIISHMPREQRREYERKGPDEKGKMLWLEGPALQLDLLAVYR